MKFFDEFRTFIARGSLIDMAVGIAVGAAFGAIARSLVSDVIMPVVALALGDAPFSDLFVVLRSGAPAGPYETLEAAQAAGAITLNYGVLLNTVVTFLIIALVVFMLVRTVNRLREREEQEPTRPSEKACPYCALPIPLSARRCPHCTSELEPAS